MRTTKWPETSAEPTKIRDLKLRTWAANLLAHWIADPKPFVSRDAVWAAARTGLIPTELPYETLLCYFYVFGWMFSSLGCDCGRETSLQGRSTR